MHKKTPQKLMMLLPCLTAGVWRSNNAGFTLFFPNGFQQEQQCVCPPEQPDWWASGKAGLRCSETKPGCRDWPELPAALSLGCAQGRKHSHCRKHLPGKPRGHQEYLGDAVTHVWGTLGAVQSTPLPPHIVSATGVCWLYQLCVEPGIILLLTQTEEIGGQMSWCKLHLNSSFQDKIDISFHLFILCTLCYERHKP